MLRANNFIARKFERCRGSVFLVTKNRVYVSTIVDSRNRTAAYVSKDVPSSTTDQTGLHLLVKNIEDDGYGTFLQYNYCTSTNS